MDAKEKFENKLRVQKLLFEHGNSDPKEDQVEKWLQYEKYKWVPYVKSDKQLKHYERKILGKMELLKQVGMYARYRALEQRLLESGQSTLEGINKYLEQMQIRAQRYNPEVLESLGGSGKLLNTIIGNYVRYGEEEIIQAATNIQAEKQIKSLTGANLLEVAHDIRQLAYLGLNSEHYRIKLSKPGYKEAWRNIRMRKLEREKSGKNFDLVIFDPYQSHYHTLQSKYLLVTLSAKIPYRAVLIGKVHYHRDLLQDLDVSEVHGGGKISFGKDKITTYDYSRQFGLALGHDILKQHFGFEIQIEQK